MIYFVEIPHQGVACCWSALDRANALRLLSSTDAYLRSGESVYEETTVREILGEHGYESLEDSVGESDEEYLADLVQRFGLDAKIYRGYGSEEYTTDVIDEFDAWVAWLARDLHSLKVFESDSEAAAALANDLEWRGHQGDLAQRLLKEALERNS